MFLFFIKLVNMNYMFYYVDKLKFVWYNFEYFIMFCKLKMVVFMKELFE